MKCICKDVRVPGMDENYGTDNPKDNSAKREKCQKVHDGLREGFVDTERNPNNPRECET